MQHKRQDKIALPNEPAREMTVSRVAVLVAVVARCYRSGLRRAGVLYLAAVSRERAA